MTFFYYHHLLTFYGRVEWEMVLPAHLFTVWLIKCSHGQYLHQVLLLALEGSSGHPRYCEAQSQTVDCLLPENTGIFVSECMHVLIFFAV